MPELVAESHLARPVDYKPIISYCLGMKSATSTGEIVISEAGICGDVVNAGVASKPQHSQHGDRAAVTLQTTLQS